MSSATSSKRPSDCDLVGGQARARDRWRPRDRAGDGAATGAGGRECSGRVLEPAGRGGGDGQGGRGRWRGVEGGSGRGCSGGSRSSPTRGGRGGAGAGRARSAHRAPRRV